MDSESLAEFRVPAGFHVTVELSDDELCEAVYNHPDGPRHAWFSEQDNVWNHNDDSVPPCVWTGGQNY